MYIHTDLWFLDWCPVTKGLDDLNSQTVNLIILSFYWINLHRCSYVELCGLSYFAVSPGKINCLVSIWEKIARRGKNENRKGSYLNARSVLNLDGHLLCIDLDFSGVEITCAHKRKNT